MCVGSNGSALGLTNNKSYTVQQLLAQINLLIKNGQFGTNAFNAANAIFSDINQTGDIV